MKKKKSDRKLDHIEQNIIYRLRYNTRNFFKKIPARKILLSIILSLNLFNNLFAKDIPPSNLSKLKTNAERINTSDRNLAIELEKDLEQIEIHISQLLEEQRHFEALEKIINLKNALEKSGLMEFSYGKETYKELDKLYFLCMKHPAVYALEHNLKMGFYKLNGEVVFLSRGYENWHINLSKEMLNFALEKYPKESKTAYKREIGHIGENTVFGVTTSPKGEKIYVLWINSKIHFKLNERTPFIFDLKDEKLPDFK